jgi:C4-dicarboxylate transporter DctM subunit
MTFLVLLAALIGLLYLGMPMFAALFLLPLAVLLYVEGGVPALGEMVIGKLDGYLLVAIPLFMLMAHVMVRGRVVDDLYGAAFALLRRVRGGVGIATVAACTVFAAISGSSVATALTWARSPSRRCCATACRGAAPSAWWRAAGRSGILIPPSRRWCSTPTSPRPRSARCSWPASCRADDGGHVRRLGLSHRGPRPRAGRRAAAGARRRGAAPSPLVLSLPVFVLGGIYFGVFTATEAAGTGTLYAILVARWSTAR